MTLQEKMVLYRAKHNISQAELAKKCNLSLQTVHCIESGIQSPSRVTEAKIRLVVDSDKEE